MSQIPASAPGQRSSDRIHRGRAAGAEMEEIPWLRDCRWRIVWKRIEGHDWLSVGQSCLRRYRGVTYVMSHYPVAITFVCALRVSRRTHTDYFRVQRRCCERGSYGQR